MSEAEYSPVEEYESAVDLEPADSVPSERKNRFDKLMAVCWGTSFALVGLLLALATLIVIWVKAPEEEPIAFELDSEPYLAIASGAMPTAEAMMFTFSIAPADPQLYVFKIPK